MNVIFKSLCVSVVKVEGIYFYYITRSPISRLCTYTLGDIVEALCLYSTHFMAIVPVQQKYKVECSGVIGISR